MAKHSTKTKSKTKKAEPQSELRGLMEKAVARGEKLRKTLTKIVVQTKLDVSHPAQTLLKALDKTLDENPTYLPYPEACPGTGC
jgi:hypothetical protein